MKSEVEDLEERLDAMRELIRELWQAGRNALQRLPKDSIDRIRLQNALKAVSNYANSIKKQDVCSENTEATTKK